VRKEVERGKSKDKKQWIKKIELESVEKMEKVTEAIKLTSYQVQP
jgi:hypothetical protein